MRKFARFSISLAAFIYLVLSLLTPDCQAADPILARLSFWVPPERMAGLEVESAAGDAITVRDYPAIACDEVTVLSSRWIAHRAVKDWTKALVDDEILANAFQSKFAKIGGKYECCGD